MSPSGRHRIDGERYVTQALTSGGHPSVCPSLYGGPCTCGTRDVDVVVSPDDKSAFLYRGVVEDGEVLHPEQEVEPVVGIEVLKNVMAMAEGTYPWRKALELAREALEAVEHVQCQYEERGCPWCDSFSGHNDDCLRERALAEIARVVG
jgi:hypothetical protein